MKLEQRAAKYFGVHHEPHAAIKVSRRSCFLVMRRYKTGLALGYYSEKNPARIEAEYWWLDEAKRKALADALHGSGEETP